MASKALILLGLFAVLLVVSEVAAAGMEKPESEKTVQPEVYGHEGGGYGGEGGGGGGYGGGGGGYGGRGGGGYGGGGGYRGGHGHGGHEGRGRHGLNEDVEAKPGV